MYQSHVFLEVRILLSSKEKAFCSCFIGDHAGSCPVCRREADARPAVNPKAARLAYTLAHALDCELSDRGPYDLPKGSPAVPEKYNLSGASVKIGTGGFMDIEFHRRKKKIRIQEVRIEEYTGRLTHQNGETRMDYSMLGSPNIRIRTMSDIELGEEAEIFLNELARRIQYMGILKGAAIDQAIRCNAYAALAKYPEKPSYFVKLRNLNSFNFVRKAINAELHRQEDILISGGTVTSESRLWNERQERTEFYQSRESASTLETRPLGLQGDFKCPPAILAELRASAIEHPSDRQNRFISAMGLARSRAEFICDEKARADFFEDTVSAGADPMETAHWLMSEVTGYLRKIDKSIQDSPLSPRRFAAILKLFRERTINSHIAKQLIHAVVETDRDPAELMAEREWNQINDREALRAVVRDTVAENGGEAARLREGDMAPLEFLTGVVMKKTKGLADPAMTKELLKEELKISLIRVLAMGGTISGNIVDGEIAGGDEKVLKTMIAPEHASKAISFVSIPTERLLSEEIQPADWAALVKAVADAAAAGTVNGVVITHGTDTLSYTAALIYWLFADAPFPIVFTASVTPPGTDPQDPQDEARGNLNRAIALAKEKERGVYVVFGDRVLSPLNLKFSRPSGAGFTNWNMGEPVHAGTGLMSDYSDADGYVMRQLLSDAADRMFLARVFPGMRADRLLPLTEAGVSCFFLELYEKGTGSMRETPYSLKSLLIQGGRRGCRFYCTSQQESTVDFSGYSTARRMWREGAIPMGSLTTESAIALYFAANLVCDTQEELDQIMESAGQN